MDENERWRSAIGRALEDLRNDRTTSLRERGAERVRDANDPKAEPCQVAAS